MEIKRKESFRFIYLLGILSTSAWFLLNVLSYYYSWEHPLHDHPKLHEWPLTGINFILVEIVSGISILYYSIRRRYFGIAVCAMLAHAVSIWFIAETEITVDPAVNTRRYIDMVYYTMNSCWILLYVSILLSYAVVINRYLLAYALVSLVFLSLNIYYSSRLVYPLTQYLWVVVMLAELIMVPVYWQAYINTERKPDTDVLDKE